MPSPITETGYAIAHQEQRYFLTGLFSQKKRAIDECIDVLYGSEYRTTSFERRTYWQQARSEGWRAVPVRISELRR